MFAFIATIFGGESLQNMYLSVRLSFSKIVFFISVGLYAGLALPCPARGVCTFVQRSHEKKNLIKFNFGFPEILRINFV